MPFRFGSGLTMPSSPKRPSVEFGRERRSGRPQAGRSRPRSWSVQRSGCRSAAGCATFRPTRRSARRPSRASDRRPRTAGDGAGNARCARRSRRLENAAGVHAVPFSKPVSAKNCSILASSGSILRNKPARVEGNQHVAGSKTTVSKSALFICACRSVSSTSLAAQIARIRASRACATCEPAVVRIERFPSFRAVKARPRATAPLRSAGPSDRSGRKGACAP